MDTLKTLQQAIIHFSNPENCIAYLSAKRWPDGVVRCPNCGTDKVTYMPSRRVWQCKARHPKAQFSIKVGTIYEDSAIGLDKWLTATWMLSNCKNGVSSYEIARRIGVTQKSAWFMLQRIRLSLQDQDTNDLTGQVEVDETFIGGKARNLHKTVRAKKITGTGANGKVVVMGMLERGGKVKATVVPKRDAETLQPIVLDAIAAGSEIMTDELGAYVGLDAVYVHNVVNHRVEYVKGHMHTNGLENFWSLLKRGLNGTYISVEPFHLFRYIDEQAFRYNNRKKKGDVDRFNLALTQVYGRRLTYAQVTGKAKWVVGAGSIWTDEFQQRKTRKNNMPNQLLSREVLGQITGVLKIAVLGLSC